MPLFSRQFQLWSRLINRFTLEPSPVEDNPAPMVDTTIYPITDADKLLSIPTIASDATMDIQAAAGSFVVAFTVPAGERWTLLAAWREGTSGASSIMVSDGSLSQRLTIQDTAGQVFNTTRVDLPEGWSIGLETTGNAGDSARDILALYLVEDAY